MFIYRDVFSNLFLFIFVILSCLLLVYIDFFRFCILGVFGKVVCFWILGVGIFILLFGIDLDRVECRVLFVVEFLVLG